MAYYVEYEIRKIDDSTYEVVSIVTKNGREYINFVASGSEGYCLSTKQKLEKL